MLKAHHTPRQHLIISTNYNDNEIIHLGKLPAVNFPLLDAKLHAHRAALTRGHTTAQTTAEMAFITSLMTKPNMKLVFSKLEARKQEVTKDALPIG